MTEPVSIARRKDEHLDLALEQARGTARPSPFDALHLEHCALPELKLDEVDLSTTFLGRPMAAPFLISSMTGGPARGEQINRNLAEAAGALGIALAVGSQRIALEREGSGGLSRALRAAAPKAVLLANLGAGQLVRGYGVEEARRAVEMIDADAIIIHLNPLQEALQPGGDRDWRGVLNGISALAATPDLKVVVKEVGFGITAAVARRLRDAGVSAIDVAGAGGTDWAALEGARAGSKVEGAVASAFSGWGLATPAAVKAVRAACPDLPLIASGGIRNGVDAAKALALGADLVGQAGGALQAALTSPEAVVEHFSIMRRQLQIACFCTGSADLSGLRRVSLTSS